MRKLVRAVNAVALIVAPRIALGGQDTIGIRDTGQPQWRVELRRIARLEAPASQRSLAFPTSVLRDAHGSFYVLDALGPHPIWVFDSVGRPARTISPNEALIDRSIVRALALAPPDTLHVISGGDAVFDRAGRLVRKQPIPPEANVFRAIGLPSGTMVIQAIVRTPDLFGYPLHVLNPAGKRLVSFGAGPAEAFDGNPSSVLGVLAASGNAMVWSSNQRQYRLSLWDVTGTLVKVLDRRVSWFQPWHVWDGRMDVKPPPPRLASAWQDVQGRLFVLSAVPAASWAPVPGRHANGEAPAATAAEYEKANDTILEVIDPQRGAVTASHRFRGVLIGFVNDTLVAGMSTDRRNRVGVDVWHVSLVPFRR
jgi:hypothetical protein